MAYRLLTMGRGIQFDSHPGYPGQTCRIRNGCHNQTTANPVLPWNPENRRPGDPGHHCPALRRVPAPRCLPASGHAAPALEPRCRSGSGHPAYWTRFCPSGTPSTNKPPGVLWQPVDAPGCLPSGATTAAVRRVRPPASNQSATHPRKRHQQCLKGVLRSGLPMRVWQWVGCLGLRSR